MNVNEDGGEFRSPKFQVIPDFADRCLDEIKHKFHDDYDHYPADQFLDSLKAIAETVKQIVTGKAKDAIYISPLDVGVGKTTTVSAVLKVLSANGYFYRDKEPIGSVICLHRKEQIENFIRDTGLPENLFAVLVQRGTKTADGEHYFSDLGLGQENIDKAQILLTTQAMVHYRLKYKTWEEARPFFYRGKPRPLRIWDESFALRQDFSISEEQIEDCILAAGRACPRELREWANLLLEQLRKWNLEQNSVVEIPEIGTEISVYDVLERMPYGKVQHYGSLIENLISLTNVRKAHLRMTDKDVPVLLQYEKRLPQDILPIIVLEAGADQKAVYQQQPEAPIWLPSAVKRYDNVKVELRTGSSGARSFWKEFDHRMKQTVEDIRAHPDKKVLIIHPKPFWYADRDRIPKMMEAMLTKDERQRVSTLHWGRHDSINDFKDCNLVIVHTLYHKPDTAYEIMAYAAANRPINKPLAKDEIREVRYSDLAASVRQGLGRASLRQMEGDQAKPCKIIMYLPKSSAVKNSLRSIYPGIQIENADGKQARDEQAIAFILDRIEDQGRVTFPEIREAIDILAPHLSRLFNTPAMAAAMQAEGLEVVNSKPKYIHRRNKQDGDSQPSDRCALFGSDSTSAV